ncbi:DUF1254 domain-containing protein [Luteibacter rhizovicinus]|uniref:DUF1254 domain-containing protein n=1 Tax=Luteibacter rhizovicinus TaxID=242606 RepID=UPI001C67420B|nr:DUF1254 domain-containing protein [Luteibacter rhizovicinus]
MSGREREMTRTLSRATFLAVFLAASLGLPRPALAVPEAAADAVTEAARRVLEARAAEAVIWGMPVVNYDLMYQAALRHGALANQIVYWSRPPNAKNQTLTPNPDTIYLMPFISTKDVGPVVVEIPPADHGVINGSIMDCWQTALVDVGPAGVDKGKGGKYLVLPPDYKGEIPEGYIPLPSGNPSNYALLRSVLKSGSKADIAKAVAYAKRIKVYPLSQAAHPAATIFVDVNDELFDSSIPYDMRFFQSLDRMIQSEPWLTRDKVMIDLLKSIGIEKGRAFLPDQATQAALSAGIATAHAWLEARYEAGFVPAYFDGTHWSLPVSPEFMKGIMSNYAAPDSYPVDSRGTAYSFAFFSAKHLGQGQFYLIAIHDRDGHALNGNQTYRLTVPAGVPVSQYWSVTAYNRDTHTLIREMPWASRSSLNPGLKKNADGSVDIVFGPKAPKEGKANWVPTDPKGQFEAMFRFYGPEKALSEKTWHLPDIQAGVQ